MAIGDAVAGLAANVASVLLIKLLANGVSEARGGEVGSPLGLALLVVVAGTM